MGVSTDGILFYGYCWDEECELIEDEREDEDGDKPEWMEVILKKRGHKDPWDNFPSEQVEAMPYQQRRERTEAWIKENEKAIDAWHILKSDCEKEFACEIDGHCSGDCTMPLVAIAASKITAWRGYPKKVESLAVDPAWPGLLDRFMSELGIEKPEGQDSPAWWLVSYWG